MAWKMPGGNGGGPWGGGGGGRNPWERGPGGSGGPDFERFIRREGERFRRILQGHNGPGRVAALAVLAILVIWGLSGFYQVDPNEVGVVQRFGRFVGITDPGLNYHLPAPIETVTTPDVTRNNEIDLGVSVAPPPGLNPGRPTDSDSLMLTGDQNIVDINFAVFWRVKDPEQFLFNVRDPENTVRVVAESAMREVIGTLPIMSALSEDKQSIIDHTQQRMQQLLDTYKAGVTVVRVQLLKVDPPPEVIDAFNDVQRAKADQERLANEAQAYQNGVVPQAQGDAQGIIQQAEAYREQVVDQAQGDAQRFTSVLDAYRAAPDVTARRMYLDTLEDVLKSTPKVIVDPQLRGVVPYLPLPGAMPGLAPAGGPAGATPAPSSPAPAATGPSASAPAGTSAAAARTGGSR